MRCGQHDFRHRWILFSILCIIVLSPHSAAVSASQGIGEERSATTSHELKNIRVVFQDGAWHVVLSGPESMTYRAIKTVDPLRLVLDLSNAVGWTVPTPLVVENEIIGTIETKVLMLDPQPLTRVEIGMNRDISYRISKGREGIRVTFDKVPVLTKTGARHLDTAAGSEQEAVRRRPHGEKLVTSSRHSAKKFLRPADKIVAIKSVTIGQELRVYIRANGPLARHKAFHLQNPPRVVVDFLDVKASETRDTLRLNGPLVKNVRLGLYADKVRIVFDLTHAIPYQVTLGDDRLVVSFQPGSSFPSR